MYKHIHKKKNLFIELTPVKITSVQCEYQQFRSCEICRKRNVVCVTQSKYIIYIRLMFFRVKRVSEKNHHIYVVVLNL